MLATEFDKDLEDIVQWPAKRKLFWMGHLSALREHEHAQQEAAMDEQRQRQHQQQRQQYGNGRTPTPTPDPSDVDLSHLDPRERALVEQQMSGGTAPNAGTSARRSARTRSGMGTAAPTGTTAGSPSASNQDTDPADHPAVAQYRGRENAGIVTTAGAATDEDDDAPAF